MSSRDRPRLQLLGLTANSSHACCMWARDDGNGHTQGVATVANRLAWKRQWRSISLRHTVEYTSMSCPISRGHLGTG